MSSATARPACTLCPALCPKYPLTKGEVGLLLPHPVSSAPRCQGLWSCPAASGPGGPLSSPPLATTPKKLLEPTVQSSTHLPAWVPWLTPALVPQSPACLRALGSQLPRPRSHLLASEPWAHTLLSALGSRLPRSPAHLPTSEPCSRLPLWRHFSATAAALSSDSSPTSSGESRPVSVSSLSSSKVRGGRPGTWAGLLHLLGLPAGGELGGLSQG